MTQQDQLIVVENYSDANRAASSEVRAHPRTDLFAADYHACMLRNAGS